MPKADVKIVKGMKSRDKIVAVYQQSRDNKTGDDLVEATISSLLEAVRS